MPATSSDGMWAAVGAAAAAALTHLARVIRPRKARAERAAEERARLDAEWARLDAEKHRLLAEVRDELAECRRRSDELEAMVRAERLRTAMLIRALQEAGIPVPDAAMLQIDFDAATGEYRLRDVA
jgi:hypothetical protein